MSWNEIFPKSVSKKRPASRVSNGDENGAQPQVPRGSSSSSSNIITADRDNHVDAEIATTHASSSASSSSLLIGEPLLWSSMARKIRLPTWSTSSSEKIIPVNNSSSSPSSEPKAITAERGNNVDVEATTAHVTPTCKTIPASIDNTSSSSSSNTAVDRVINIKAESSRIEMKTTGTVPRMTTSFSFETVPVNNTSSSTCSNSVAVVEHGSNVNTSSSSVVGQPLLCSSFQSEQVSPPSSSDTVNVTNGNISSANNGRDSFGNSGSSGTNVCEEAKAAILDMAKFLFDAGVATGPVHAERYAITLVRTENVSNLCIYCNDTKLFILYIDYLQTIVLLAYELKPIYFITFCIDI